MIASKELTNEEVSEFAGHVDFNTTQKYYVFSTTSIDQRKDSYEKAICTKLEL